MPDSDFWRDLAEQFRPVDPQELLRAAWTCKVKVEMEETPVLAQWRLVGTDYRTRSVQFAFEALARRGGPKIFPLMESLTGWLEALRQQRLNVENESMAIETSPDGTVVSHIYMGSIMRLRQASVDLCKFHESLALETERWADAIKQQKNDPRNWPSVVQHWEGIKAIKELTSGPVEEIPESVVRTHLAGQHGIRPEEVTLGQIRRAAIDLSARYGAVTIVPDSPQLTEVRSEAQQVEAASRSGMTDEEHKAERKAIRDAYLSRLNGPKIKILDICWGAGQHYSEWKRWLRNAVKDGSAPDLAFRAILTSGKRPEEYRKQPRPAGWE
jgi:hypothetical protein